MEQLKYKIIPSPVGELKIVVEKDALVAILWDNEKPKRVLLTPSLESKHDPFLLEVEKQLNAYFQTRLQTFNLPLQAQGTPFQKAVWEQLALIPYGATWSYKEVAQKIAAPDAVRAVGAAIGRNPISIVIPCHRVIATNGSLTGFAGGLARKRLLLDLESNR